jgi:hypothetical protein
MGLITDSGRLPNGKSVLQPLLRALMKPRTTQLFLPYIHTFRALAILFIVTGHAVDAFIWPDGGDLERLLRIVFCNGSALFVFIAGYLFQHLSPRFEARNYYISKIKNVLIPYLLISIPAIVLFTTVMQRNTVWVLFYLTGYHLAPLWFVPMITIFYVIAPALIKLDRNHYLYYMLPFFVVISLLISRGSPSQSFLHFLSVYVLGMACSRFKDVIGNAMVKYVFLIPVLVLHVAMAPQSVRHRLLTSTLATDPFVQRIFPTVCD